MAFLHRIVALVAIGSAAAFSPLMSSAPSRRTAIQGAGAAAVMSPLLRPAAANADSIALPGKMRRNPESPHLQILDERGCSRISAEYKGRKSNTDDDKMCVVLKMKRIPFDESAAELFVSQILGDIGYPSTKTGDE